MGEQLASAWTWLLRGVIPPQLAMKDLKLRQAKRIVAFAMAMLLWVPVYAVIFALLKAPYSAEVVCGTGMAVLLLLAFLRLGLSVSLCGNLLVAIFSFTYTLLALGNGGAEAPALIWYTSIPLMSLWVCGTRSGILWTASSLVTISLFYVAREMAIDVPNELTPQSMRLLEWSGLLGITLCLLLLMVVLRRVEANARESMAAMLQQVKAADRAKSEFLANMSHEIRTPMTAILGFTDILAAEDRDSTKISRAEALQTIRRNGAHLLQVIGDILDLSKIEVGKFMLEEVCCSPLETIQDVVRLMHLRAESRGISLSLKVQGPLPATIRTDPLRYRQILINLLGNAIKFTDFGTVRVEVNLARQDGKSLLACTITDCGEGIPADHLDFIFQPFTQGDMSTARRYGGTGLGLAIAKRLAIMLGGDITVESKVGIGSTFRVTIDTGSLDGVEMLTISEDASLSGVQTNPTVITEDVRLDCRVLLAEDGSDNRRLISFVLEKAGAVVVAVEDGQACIQHALRARDEGKPFDVILVDIQMPIVDGYQATARLRSAGYKGPIIAITAHAMRGDRERCLAAGCDDYASKPIDRHALVRLVAEYASGLQSAGGGKKDLPPIDSLQDPTYLI